jgi:hypothetical protein
MENSYPYCTTSDVESGVPEEKYERLPSDINIDQE